MSQNAKKAVSVSEPDSVQVVVQPAVNHSGSDHNGISNIALINHSTLPQVPLHAVDTMPTKTFANSNYKRFYMQGRPSCFGHNLLHAVHEMVTLVARRINPELNP